MKEVIIILVILAVIITGAIYTKNYLISSSNELVKELEGLKGKIKTEESSNNRQDAISLSEDIYHKWKEADEKWSIVVLHSELDLIETALVETKAAIKLGNFWEANQKIDVSIFLLNHINQKEKFFLKNIF